MSSVVFEEEIETDGDVFINITNPNVIHVSEANVDKNDVIIINTKNAEEIPSNTYIKSVDASGTLTIESHGGANVTVFKKAIKGKNVTIVTGNKK